MSDLVQLPLFDYKALDQTTRMVVMQRADEIRDELRKSIQSIVNVGEALADVQERLAGGAGGGFQAWLKKEFDWSRATAYNFINVYNLNAEHPLGTLQVQTTALYLMAQPSADEQVVDDLLQRAAAGEPITYTIASTALGKRADVVPDAPVPDELPPEYDPTDVAQNPTAATHPVYGVAIVAARCPNCREEHYNWKAQPVKGDGIPRWQCLKCYYQARDEDMIVLTPRRIADEAQAKAVAAAERARVAEAAEQGRRIAAAPTATGKVGGIPMQNNKGPALDEPHEPDNCQTPPYALLPIVELLSADWTYWESACGEGLLVEALHAAGFPNVKATDLSTGHDYFTTEMTGYDVELTNMPFSKKVAWLERAYRRERPFALLAPGSTLFLASAQRLFKHYGLEVIIPSKRICFKMPNKGWGGDAQFSTVWLTWQLNVGSPMTFYEYTREQWDAVPDLYKSRKKGKKKTQAVLP